MKKKYILEGPFERDSGDAWIVSLPEACLALGVGASGKERSDLILFENDVEIGPSNCGHDEIRMEGAGRHSHWNEELYFSTSDGSDPNKNGRSYWFIVDDTEQGPETVDFTEKALEIGESDNLFLEAFRANVNRNDRALYNLLHVYRMLEQYLEKAGTNVIGKHLLEMGTSPGPSLALICLAKGATHFYGNNIFRVGDTLPMAQYLVIKAVLEGLGSIDEPLSKFVDEVDQNTVRLKREFYTDLSPIGAESIDLPDESVDVIFSFAVMEHVEDPLGVFDNCKRLLKKGGVTIHAIDMRDHRDFTKPREYLNLSEAEYAHYCESTGNFENRWRLSQYREALEGDDIEIVETFTVTAGLPLNSVGRTDNMSRISLKPVGGAAARQPESAITVTEEMREKMSEPFNKMSLEDLSAIGVTFIARRLG